MGSVKTASLIELLLNLKHRIEAWQILFITGSNGPRPLWFNSRCCGSGKCQVTPNMKSVPILDTSSQPTFIKNIQNGILRLNKDKAGKCPVTSNMKSGSILETSSHPPCYQSREQSFKKVWIYTRLGWMLRNNATKEDEINLIFLLGHCLPSNEWHKLGSNKYDLFNFSPLPKKSIACLNRTHCALLFWKLHSACFLFPQMLNTNINRSNQSL